MNEQVLEIAENCNHEWKVKNKDDRVYIGCCKGDCKYVIKLRLFNKHTDTLVKFKREAHVGQYLGEHNLGPKIYDAFVGNIDDTAIECKGDGKCGYIISDHLKLRLDKIIASKPSKLFENKLDTTKKLSEQKIINDDPNPENWMKDKEDDPLLIVDYDSIIKNARVFN